MKENIELARVRGFSDIMSDSFGLFRQNFKPLMKCCLVICGLFIAANIASSIFAKAGNEEVSTLSGLGLFNIAISLLSYFSLILTTLSYYALYKEKGNKAPQLVEVWGYFRYYFFRFILSNFLLFLLVIAGSFLCLIPGIYIGVVLSLFAPIMVMENGNLQYSFNKAFKIIKDNWWFTFGLLLIISIITSVVFLALMIPTFVIYGMGDLIAGKNLDGLANVLSAVTIGIGQLLWVLLVTAVTLIYFTLTEHKEGTSLLDRINTFGKNDNSASALSSEQY